MYCLSYEIRPGFYSFSFNNCIVCPTKYGPAFTLSLLTIVLSVLRNMARILLFVLNKNNACHSWNRNCLPSGTVQWVSCCSILGILCCDLRTIVFFFLLVTALFVVRRHASSDYPFGIFKLSQDTERILNHHCYIYPIICMLFFFPILYSIHQWKQLNN